MRDVNNMNQKGRGRIRDSPKPEIKDTSKQQHIITDSNQPTKRSSYDIIQHPTSCALRPACR